MDIILICHKTVKNRFTEFAYKKTACLKGDRRSGDTDDRGKDQRILLPLEFVPFEHTASLPREWILDWQGFGALADKTNSNVSTAFSFPGMARLLRLL
jgi:hypothetical protein